MADAEDGGRGRAGLFGRALGLACLGFALFVTINGLRITGFSTELVVPLAIFAGGPTAAGILLLAYPERIGGAVARAVGWVLRWGDW